MITQTIKEDGSEKKGGNTEPKDRKSNNKRADNREDLNLASIMK